MVRLLFGFWICIKSVVVVTMLTEGREGAQVCSSGLLETVGAAQAGWPSGEWLRQRAGLGGRGEEQVMAGRNVGLGRGGSDWMCDLE